MSNGRTHKPKHHADACMACGGCTWRCPATVFPSLRSEAGSLRGEIYQTRPYPGAPATLPPCALACPIGQDVPAYIRAIAEGDTATAVSVIRGTNALPSVCGRVCLASCMRACTRAAIDEGLDIRGLKRYAAAAASNATAALPTAPSTGFSVAVVGAGPAGLATAHRLRQLGHRVLVLDEGSRAGGSLVDTVPSFVLPRAMVEADVGHLLAMGVETKLGVRVGRDVSWEELEREHDAVVVATGARRGLIPRLAGRELEGVLDAATFCRAAGEDGRTVVGNVVVSGGGFAALQAARVAVRLGARKTTVVHPSPEHQWPAGADAVAAARREGVEVLDQRRVVGLVGEGGRLVRVDVKLVRASNPDAVDRHALSSYGAPIAIEAALFVAAVDRRPGAGDAPLMEGMTRGVLGNLVADAEGRLGRERWFAAGEASTGAATVVDSMGTGRRVADAIHRRLAAGGGR